jgi:MFS transporter, ACS family, DAL5 transporter family protein
VQGCGFLTPRERDLAQLRLRSSNSTKGDKQRKDEGGSGGIEWSQVLLSLCDPINYVSAAIFFIMNVTYGSLPVSGDAMCLYFRYNSPNKVYLPTILNDAGFSSINAQGRCLREFFEHLLIASKVFRLLHISRHGCLPLDLCSSPTD